MFELLCLVLYIAIYVSSRFIFKKLFWKKVFRGCTLLLIIVWTAYFKVDQFILFNIWLFGVSIVLSYALYFLSLIIVGTKLSTEFIFPVKCLRYKGRIKKAFIHESLSNILSSTYEELLYRWLIQNAIYILTKSAIISICITIFVFFAVHIKKNIAVVQLLDIFVFSVAVTTWYYFTWNPLYCIAIHIFRNQLVINQKYIAIKKEADKKTKYLLMIKERKNYGV